VDRSGGAEAKTAAAGAGRAHEVAVASCLKALLGVDLLVGGGDAIVAARVAAEALSAPSTSSTSCRKRAQTMEARRSAS